MSRIVLVQWTEAAGGRAAELERALTRVPERKNARVETVVPRGADDLAALWRKPPAAFVIDLDRRPSDGWNLGILLRRRKATRAVPLVFAGGDAARRRRARGVLPDAAFATWRGAAAALARVLAQPPAAPRVPDTFAGYSGTPLAKKLGIQEGAVVALLGAPDDFEDTLGELPPGVRLRRRAGGSADLVLLFCPRASVLEKRFGGAERTVAEGGGLWLAWPKKASGLQTDLAEGDVRAWGLERGWVDYKIAAIDATWSGLKFARRKA